MFLLILHCRKKAHNVFYMGFLCIRLFCVHMYVFVKKIVHADVYKVVFQWRCLEILNCQIFRFDLNIYIF